MLLTSSSLLAATNETSVWSFTAGTDGTQPRAGLLALSKHALYGTASSGGINQSGTVFKIDPHTSARKEQTIYNFTGGADGSLPSGALINDAKGALYGTTARNGAGNYGTVFSLTPPLRGQTAWTETTLWSFTGGADGGQPIGSLILDRFGSGTLYGTTNFGGTYGSGVVFSLSPPAAGTTSWTERVLWSFTGSIDGAKPAAALVQDANGVLYGTASAGGADGGGTVFTLAPPALAGTPWTFSIAWTFTGGQDGATPMGTLNLDSSGSLYGTTEFGGSGDCAQPRYPYYPQPEVQTVPAYDADYIPLGGNACGVVFKLTPPAIAGLAWTQSIIWSFQAGDDGGNPVGDLLLDRDGTIRGMTPQYGDPGPDKLNEFADKGNVFLLTPPAQAGDPYTETTTLSLITDGKGIYPRGGVVRAQDNALYFTETFGGSTWVHVKDYGYGSVVSTH